MELRTITLNDVENVMGIINSAKSYLKEQGIDQWQSGYPDTECIKNDAINGKGYAVIDGNEILGYLCIDFDGEPVYNDLKGKWNSDKKYVVVHRLALNSNVRGKKLASKVFGMVEEISLEKGINYIRIDTDEGNLIMQHILKKSGFSFCGTIIFDNSEKIAFDKIF